MDFLEQLHATVLLGDGAMGTRLFELGIDPSRCLEELCASAPDAVRGIHDGYIAAGARLIRTNSFGANAVRLALTGNQNRVNEINWSAAKLARLCVKGKHVYVAGSVGPLGMPAEVAKSKGMDRESMFREQLGALLDGGVDVIFFEAFVDVDELALALRVKQSLHHCPAICSMACSADGNLPSGQSIEDALRMLRGLEADVVGINCINGPDTALDLLPRITSDTPISVFPSAGLPQSVDGRVAYEATAADFAAAARRLAEGGARLIGGCCGTGPAHIASMASALAGMQTAGARAD
jgi:homocysteine S-methyltransferase